MKILYICAWAKNKECTWSGTTYFLYKSLKNKCNIENFDVALNNIEDKIVKISQMRIINGKLKRNDIDRTIKNFFYQKKLNKCKEKSDNIILQIGEYGVFNNPSYIYQDLSVDSLLYFKKNKPELFRYSGFQNTTLKELEKRNKQQLKIYNNLTGIFTMSKWLADNLENNTKISKDKIHYVGAGVNIDVSKIDYSQKKGNKVLFVGRDFFRKGGDLVYEAFKILKTKLNKDVELYIAGPERFPIKEKFKGVHFLGNLSYENLITYFNICDIFCMPSRFEAYGLVFIEALVFGLPCIGRNEFAMKEFIQSGVNGYLIEDDSINELAIKMNELLKNKKIKENVIKNRENYIYKYSWDTVAERMVNIMQNDKNIRS